MTQSHRRGIGSENSSIFDFVNNLLKTKKHALHTFLLIFLTIENSITIHFQIIYT